MFQESSNDAVDVHPRSEESVGINASVSSKKEPPDESSSDLPSKQNEVDRSAEIEEILSGSSDDDLLTNAQSKFKEGSSEPDHGSGQISFSSPDSFDQYATEHL